ncbi:MAG: thioredoxin-dependent thiol peroxidase [Candidatus Acidiferrales bacterium]|jgi:peroxiredoxin Q/BCP
MLKVGDPAPDFHVSGDDGRPISLADFRGRTVVLYFYPKASTPGCTCEAGEFRDSQHEFEKLGAVVLGCSADQVEAQARFKKKEHLNFTLLSDPQFELIENYGARRMKKFLGKSFLGIVRSTVLIGPDGKILRIWETAPAKGHAAEVLKAVRALQHNMED